MGNLFGSKNQTTTTKPSPQYLQAWNQLWPQAQAAASKASVAPINATQKAAIGQLNNAQTSAAPYFTQASNLATNAAGPVTGGIGQYLNPYQNDVINATMANINETNAQQANNLRGNAIASGAWGGDRAGVAQAELARQQDLASNQTLAGLNANSYTTALGAAQNDASRGLSAAGTLGSLGTAQQAGGVNAANALLGAGTLQQQTAQQQANLPLTTSQFLSSILNGSNLGGSQTTPGPSLFSQLAGLGLTAGGLGLFKKGGGIRGYDDGGEIDPTLDEDPEDAMMMQESGVSPLGPIGTMAMADTGGGQGMPLPVPAVSSASAPVPTGLAAAAPVQKSGLGATLASPEDSRMMGMDDKHLALLEAGLGILGSRSPFAGQAIGEGGLQGLAAYRQQKQMEMMANYRNELANYRNSMAQSAEQRAQAQANYYNKRAGQQGDQSWIETGGPTMTLVHKAADGTVETHDLGIPTAAWQRTKQENQRLGIESSVAAENARHHKATETAIGDGASDTPWTQFQ